MKLFPRVIITLMLAFTFAGCSFTTTGPAPTQSPTVDIQPTLDAAHTEAAETVAAKLTALPTTTPIPPTATLADTATSVPTVTPLPPTDTIVPLPTLTFTSTPRPTVIYTAAPPLYGCKLIAATTSGVHSGKDFNMLWTIKNVGTGSWSLKEFDIRYISGLKMQTSGDVYNLSRDVAPGDSVQLSVGMLAPTAAGAYSATWAFTYGTTPICSLPVYIVVK